MGNGNDGIALVYPMAPPSRPSVSELAKRFDKAGRDVVKRGASPRAEDQPPSSPKSPVVCSMHEFLASQRLRDEELRRRYLSDRIRLHQNAHAIALAQAHERAVEFVRHEKLQFESPCAASNDQSCQRATRPNDAARGEDFLLGLTDGTAEKQKADSIVVANSRDVEVESNESSLLLPQGSLDASCTSSRQYARTEDQVGDAPHLLQLGVVHLAAVLVVSMIAVLLWGILKRQGTIDSFGVLSMKRRGARELAVFVGSVDFEATYFGPEKHIVDLGCPWPIG